MTDEYTTINDEPTAIEEELGVPRLQGMITVLQQQKTGLNGQLDAALARGDRYITERDQALADAASAAINVAGLVLERDSLAQTNVELVDNNNRLTGEIIRLQAERDALAGTDFAEALREMTAHRDRLFERNNDLIAERDRANDRLERAGEAAQGFRDKVVDVASRAANEHGWCEVIDGILEELGLERPTVSYAGTMTITVQFHAELGKGKRDLPNVGWVRDSISWGDIESTIENGIEFDSDHTDGEVDDVSFVITNIRAYDE